MLCLLYNIGHVMLYNICYITYVMIWLCLLYNMCHVILTYVISCYITYVM